MSPEEISPTLNTILVVDDNPKAGRLVARLLANTSQYVHVESDPTQALAWFARNAHRVDLVLVDQDMPVLSGADVARRVWVLRPDMPIFLMSALERQEVEPLLAAMPFRGYLKKPFRSWELHMRVQSVLGV